MQSLLVQVILKHLLLDVMHLPAYYKGMQRLSHINLQENCKGPRDYLLRGSADPRQTEAGRCLIVDLLLQVILCLEQLSCGLVSAHVAGLHVVELLAPRQALLSRLLHFDVKEDQSMQAFVSVVLDLLIEAVGSPLLCEKGQRNYLTEPVYLQSAAADSRHNRSIVDDFDFYTPLHASEVEVAVCRRAEGVSHDEERHILSLRLLNHILAAGLHELAVRLYHRLLEKVLQALLAHHEDRSVHLQVHLGRRFHRLKAPHGNVLLIIQAQADHKEHHCINKYIVLIIDNLNIFLGQFL